MSRVAAALVLLCACLLWAQPSSAKPTTKPTGKSQAKIPQTKKPQANKQSAKKQSTKKPQTKKNAKPQAKLPAQSVLDSMAKKGEIIDYGEKNLAWLKHQIAPSTESSAVESSQNPTKDPAKSKAQNLTPPESKDPKDPKALRGVRMAVFGDSHIAGDFMPRVWRARFMQVDSIGFAYPIFPPFHQNLLLHYQHKGFEILNSRKDAYTPYPMGGIIARATSGQAFVQLGLNLPKKQQEQQKEEQKQQDFLMRVVFKAPSTLGAFLLRDSAGREVRLGASKKDTWEISPPLALRFPVRINALLPDAMLGGYFIDRLESSAPESTQPPAKRPKNQRYQISQSPQSFVINLGINGARSDMWLKWDRALLEKELEAMAQLDLIALSYGSNDAIATNFNDKLYRENFGALISLLRQYHPNATILLIGAPQMLFKRKDTGTYKTSVSYEAVRKATKQVAKENHTLYFDMQGFIEESGGKPKWITQALSKQDVHLTPYGYKLVAESIAYHLEALLAKQKLPKSAKPTKFIKSMEDIEPIEPAKPITPAEPAQGSELEPAEETSGQKAHEKNAHKQKEAHGQESVNQQEDYGQRDQQSNAPNNDTKDAEKNTAKDTTSKPSSSSTSQIPLPPDSSAPEEIWQDLEMKDF